MKAITSCKMHVKNLHTDLLGVWLVWGSTRSVSWNEKHTFDKRHNVGCLIQSAWLETLNTLWMKSHTTSDQLSQYRCDLQSETVACQDVQNWIGPIWQRPRLILCMAGDPYYVLLISYSRWEVCSLVKNKRTIKGGKI